MGDICYIYFRIECVKINKDLKFRFSRVIKPDYAIIFVIINDKYNTWFWYISIKTVFKNEIVTVFIVCLLHKMTFNFVIYESEDYKFLKTGLLNFKPNSPAGKRKHIQ